MRIFPRKSASGSLTAKSPNKHAKTARAQPQKPRLDDGDQRRLCGDGEELAKQSGQLGHSEFPEQAVEQGSAQERDADVEMDFGEDPLADVSTSSAKLARLFDETLTSVGM